MAGSGRAASFPVAIFDKLRLPAPHRFAATADFIQMGAFYCRIGFADEARQQFFHEFGPPGSRQTEGV
jgi:hypothetical protein